MKQQIPAGLSVDGFTGLCKTCTSTISPEIKFIVSIIGIYKLEIAFPLDVFYTIHQFHLNMQR